MSLPDTAMLLEDAADRIGDVALPDLQILLRRAALRLRNSSAVSFEDDVDESLRDLAGELGFTRNDTIRFIVREWMEKNTYLPVHILDEDGDVGGNA
ncbi:CopG family transcriptional regulator [Rhizobium ruizarguesonis]|uniref:CopG family transcriptional regulator n=1 Tax=Rhizobium ruizarguesonis TaxID=2081791 RepID=UPI00102F9C01|nr:CopG family transcriptional regulator [Rhizobium ruizarguesonis]TAY91876.1 CopG family transcriptional regulator [Rhizobium ruizarguesonis]